MTVKKTDRRTLKTEKALKNGLAELLTEKEIHNITVQEISDRVDIHRVTFYKHYMDIYDLYEQLEKEVFSDLGLLILKFHEDPSRDFGRELVDYIEANPKIFKMIFSPYSTSGLRIRLIEMVEGVFRLVQTEKNAVDLNDSRMEYLSVYWASGCVAVLERWAQKDFSEPKDYIIRTLAELDEHMEKYISAQLD